MDFRVFASRSHTLWVNSGSSSATWNSCQLHFFVFLYLSFLFPRNCYSYALSPSFLPPVACSFRLFHFAFSGFCWLRVHHLFIEEMEEKKWSNRSKGEMKLFINLSRRENFEGLTLQTRGRCIEKHTYIYPVEGGKKSRAVTCIMHPLGKRIWPVFFTDIITTGVRSETSV